MNIGVMPRDGEIAITPSLAKQFAQDIRTLIGKEIVFSCGNFSRKLQISGIYSGSFDDYYLDAKTEQELYGTLQEGESPVSVTYQVNGFDEVLEVVAQLTEQGIVPITAAKFERDLFAVANDVYSCISLHCCDCTYHQWDATDEAGSYALG